MPVMQGKGLRGYFYHSMRDSMSVILLLLIASLSVALLFLAAFIWSVRHHQFDDGYSPPRRILFDDPPAEDISDQPNKNQNGTHAN